MDWLRFFRPHILDRGLAYYQDGFVEDYEMDSDSIQATVQGNSDYEVQIDFINGTIHDMNCDCPYAEKGNYCKHMAAVLFYMEGETEGTINKNQEKKQGSANQKSITECSIHELVEATDETIVKNFLVDILVNNEKLYQRFKNSICYKILPEDIKRYKRQINQIFSKYAGKQGFIDYYNASFFVSELADILANDIKGMLNNQQYKEAFELTNYIFVKIGNQDIDDSDGGTGLLADMCREIWQEILEHCDQDLKKNMFQWYIKHSDGSVIDYMEEYMEQFLFANFTENEFLADKLKFIEEKIHQLKKESDSWSRSYYGGKWAIRHIEILKEQKVSPNEIWDYCIDNMDFSVVREYYIAECIKINDYEAAINALKEGKEKERSLSGLTANYSVQLKELYKQMGRTEDYIRELWSLILEYRAGDVKVFKELKSLYTKEEWIDKRELIFSKLTAYSGVDQLYKEEQLFDRLLTIVLETSGLYKLTEYEKCLKEIYPQELLNKYEVEVKKMAVHTSDRKRYRELVVILKRMKTYPGGGKKVDEIAESWRTKYRQRSAMMDELRQM